MNFSGSAPDRAEHEAHRVAHLGEQGDLALEVGAGEQLLKLLTSLGQLGVVGDAGQAALPRRVSSFWSGSQGCRAARGIRFLVKVRHLAGSSGWIQPRPIIRAAIQSVSTIMSRLIDWHDAELVLHLGEELGVVVDVVGVVDRDAGLLLEDRDRRRRLVDRVDVGRPVGDDQLLVGRRHVRWRSTSAGSCWAPATEKNGSFSAARLAPTKAAPPTPRTTVRRETPPGPPAMDSPSAADLVRIVSCAGSSDKGFRVSNAVPRRNPAVTRCWTGACWCLSA